MLAHLEYKLSVEEYFDLMLIYYRVNLFACFKNPSLFYNESKYWQIKLLSEMGFELQDLNPDKFAEFGKQMVKNITNVQ